MSDFRVVFQTTTSTELRFADATFVTEGGLVVILQNGEQRFAIPAANVIAIERLPATQPTASEPDNPVPSS